MLLKFLNVLGNSYWDEHSNSLCTCSPFLWSRTTNQLYLCSISSNYSTYSAFITGLLHKNNNCFFYIFYFRGLKRWRWCVFHQQLHTRKTQKLAAGTWKSPWNEKENHLPTKPSWLGVPAVCRESNQPLNLPHLGSILTPRSSWRMAPGRGRKTAGFKQKHNTYVPWSKVAFLLG